MAADASTCQIRSMLNEEVTEVIFAKNHSEFEKFSSDSLTESSSEEAKDIDVTPRELPVRKRGPQTKGGLLRASVVSFKETT